MRYRYILWCIVFSLLILFCLSQNHTGSAADMQKAFGEADTYYRKALNVNVKGPKGEQLEFTYNRMALQKFRVTDSLLLRNPAGFDSLHLIVSLKAGELAHYFDSLPLALHYYNQAISLKRALPALEDSLIFKPYLFSGHIHFYQNRLDSATFCFQKAEEIQEHYTVSIRESERLYNDLGVLYFQGGNYLQAGNYFRKAAEMLNKNSTYYRDFYVNYHINYAIALFKLDNYDTAYAILQGLLPYRTHLNEIYNNLGLIEKNKERYNKALEQYNKVQYNNYLEIGLDNDKASAWLSLLAYDSCRNYLERAMGTHRKYNGNNSSVDHGLTLKIYGDLEASLQQNKTALQYYQKALSQFYPSFQDTSVYANPRIFSGVFSYINLFHTLVSKATVFHSLYKESNDIFWAGEELQSFENAFQLIDYIERVYESDEARLFLEKSKYLVHEKPIDIAFELYQKTKDPAYLERAYILDQKTKASVLAFNEERNQMIAPSSDLRKKEQILKTEITRLSLVGNSISDPAVVKATASQIHELEFKLNKIQEAIAQTYPSVNVAVPSIRELQKNLLDSETRLISYHLGQKKLTTFSVTSSNFTVEQQSIYPAFFDDINDFISQLHKPSDSISTGAFEYRLSAFLLKSLSDKNHHRLIIVPDDELSYLPFEALKVSNDYLVENFSVQYQYSTSLLKKEGMDFSKASTISFAPFTTMMFADSNLQLAQLGFSADEISGLEGSSFTGKLATKKNFLEQINGHDIIHLATHAIASDSPGKPSFIVFAPWNASQKTDYLLYSPEIYNLNMKNNKLIILSACETGYGKLVKGEGLMSLSRAFAYAGCPNIITSLWKADDEATGFIARKIHWYLEKGLPIDQAVQASKKDYLADGRINPRRKLPAFWANLVFIGNYKAQTGSSLMLWVIAGLGLLTVILVPAILIKRLIKKRLP